MYSLGFLVVDKPDEKVYKYDSSGTANGSFDLTSVNSDPRGITTDGSSVLVMPRLRCMGPLYPGIYIVL